MNENWKVTFIKDGVTTIEVYTCAGILDAIQVCLQFGTLLSDIKSIELSEN